MDQAVQSHARHDVDKNGGNFVQAVEDHHASPHGYTDRVVSEGQAVGANKKSSRPREQPDSTHAEDIDKVTKIGQEKVESALVECIISNRQKVNELRRVPVVEILRVPSNDDSTEEDIENTTNE
jgi:hypothetical protein